MIKQHCVSKLSFSAVPQRRKNPGLDRSLLYLLLAILKKQLDPDLQPLHNYTNPQRHLFEKTPLQVQPSVPKH